MHLSEDMLEITSASPCIGHCTTVLGDDVCRSCLRTFDEVNRWLEMSEDERRTVNLRIALLPATPSNSSLSGGELNRSSPDKGRLGGV
jgi:predicted Fe-S protein YdhL (DUF1289 family)